MILKFRPGSFYVEAVRFEGTMQNIRVIEKWGEGQVKFIEEPKRDLGTWLEVNTPRGLMFAARGDYVLKDKNGGYMTCKYVTFEVLYGNMIEKDYR